MKKPSTSALPQNVELYDVHVNDPNEILRHTGVGEGEEEKKGL